MLNISDYNKRAALTILVMFFLTSSVVNAQNTSNMGKGFVLGPAGSLTSKKIEVISGNGSIVGRYLGDQKYSYYLQTNPTEIQLLPEQEYIVTFQYKIIETPTEGFEVIFYSPIAGAINDWLEGVTIKGVTGDKGTITLSKKLKNYSDYRVHWNIVAKGVISIDNISILKVAEKEIVGEEDSEHVVMVQDKYQFDKERAEYLLNLTSSGTLVIDRNSKVQTVVQFNEPMSFSGVIKYSKDTSFITHNVRSHLESYDDWYSIADLPVDFLRTAYDTTRLRQFPDKKDKVIVAYVNSVEYSAIGGWDPSFYTSWDIDGDARIDTIVKKLPDYVDVNVFNEPWKNYVAVYWTESWQNEIKKKIDTVAAENFDGVMFDVMTGYWTWKQAYPSMSIDDLRNKYVMFFKWASSYAKNRYGSAFVISANFDGEVHNYFPDLGKFADVGYYQNAFFQWNGSGIIDGYCLSISTEPFSNPAIEFLKQQGLAVLDMEHIGTGLVSKGLEFTNYNDRITQERLLSLFRWAIASGSTPFVATVFMNTPYSFGIPRFVRIIPGLSNLTSTNDDNWVIGCNNDDTIITGSGNDVIYGGKGKKTVDGGYGTNKVLFMGKRSDFKILKNGKELAVLGKEESIKLINIRYLIFSDDYIDVDTFKNN